MFWPWFIHCHEKCLADSLLHDRFSERITTAKNDVDALMIRGALKSIENDLLSFQLILTFSLLIRELGLLFHKLFFLEILHAVHHQRKLGAVHLSCWYVRNQRLTSRKFESQQLAYRIGDLSQFREIKACLYLMCRFEAFCMQHEVFVIYAEWTDCAVVLWCL